MIIGMITAIIIIIIIIIILIYLISNTMEIPNKFLNKKGGMFIVLTKK